MIGVKHAEGFRFKKNDRVTSFDAFVQNIT